MDLRIYKTINALHNSAYELLDRYSYDEITVEMICRKSMCGRSTFYAHYESKQALFQALVDSQVLAYRTLLEKRLSEDTCSDFVLYIHELERICLAPNRNKLISLFKIDNPNFSFEKKLLEVVKDVYLKKIGMTDTTSLMADLYAVNVLTIFKRILIEGISDKELSTIDKLLRMIIANLKT